MKTQLLAALTLTMLLLPSVLAAVDFNQPVNEQDQATFDQILQPVMKIYNLVKYIATAIAGVVLLLAGISYMFSGSDIRKRENSKNMGMYVVIGLVIIWAAPLVVKFIVG